MGCTTFLRTRILRRRAEAETTEHPISFGFFSKPRALIISQVCHGTDPVSFDDIWPRGVMNAKPEIDALLCWRRWL